MKTYRNVFREMGKTKEEIDKRLKEVLYDFFEGENKVYFPVDNEMAYIEDTGNHDVRTEGMSYGMMMCVQMDMKEEFDRLWKWTKTYMWLPSIDTIDARASMAEDEDRHPMEKHHEGYFAWSCKVTGEKNAYGPAPDGEEYFALALFFASHRWGDGEGIFQYEKEAKEILRACIHKGMDGRPGEAMWNHENKQILFVPGIDFTDPSYHLPHFYELFAQWAYEEDREFFKEAAKVSREYLAKACHPVSGMNPEYGEFDGSPMSRELHFTKDRHDWFYSDAYRTAANIGLDYEWFGVDAGQCDAPKRLMHTLFVVNKENPYVTYEVDGTPLSKESLHPVGMLATTACGALASPGFATEEEKELAKECVERFWQEPMREGKRRYYDNCLYVFAYLALSGNYRIWS